MADRTKAESSRAASRPARPPADDIEVVFRPDPPPVVVHRRPVALTVVWVIAVLSSGFALATVAWRVTDEPEDPTANHVHVGEIRSLTDGGDTVPMTCARRAPSSLGSPCLADADALAELLAGRERVLLVVNVASVRRPHGQLRCVEVLDGAAAGEPTARRTACPEHDLVVAPPR